MGLRLPSLALALVLALTWLCNIGLAQQVATGAETQQIHLDIDVSSLHDADHHLERKYHDDVHIKFIDLHDNTLCDARMSQAVDETIPCLVDRKLLQAGKNLIHAKVYLKSTGATIEHFDLNFHLGNNIPGLKKNYKIVYSLVGAGVVIGASAGLGKHIVDGNRLKHEKSLRITNTLNLNDSNNDKKKDTKNEGPSPPTAAALPSLGSQNSKPKSDSFSLKPATTVVAPPKLGQAGAGTGTGTAANAASAAGSLLGAWVKPAKSEDKFVDTVVKTEPKVKSRAVKIASGVIAGMGLLLGSLGVVFATIMKQKPPKPSSDE